MPRRLAGPTPHYATTADVMTIQAWARSTASASASGAATARHGYRRRTVHWAGLLSLVALLIGCATTPDAPTQLRQALLGLGQRAAEEVVSAPPVPEALRDQVLLLAPPDVDAKLNLAQARVQESLTRGLLGVKDGPQVLDWQPGSTPAGDSQQWLVDSRLIADGPRLRLSDRELVPYRLELRLRRPGDGAALWSTAISGAFDADAL